jgi:hypothetical protein
VDYGCAPPIDCRQSQLLRVWLGAAWSDLDFKYLAVRARAMTGVEAFHMWAGSVSMWGLPPTDRPRTVLECHRTGRGVGRAARGAVRGDLPSPTSTSPWPDSPTDASGDISCYQVP